jgi:ParB family transcriptional regulator, chromosome partitioning protein
MGKLEELRNAHSGTVGASFGTGFAAGKSPAGMSLADARPVPPREQGVVRSKHAVDIQIDRILPDSDQPREEFDPDGLARLAESLKTRGQLQPIRVRWDEGRGVYIIIMGERRWRAAVQAGLATMSCVIHEKPIESGEQLALQLIENALREDLRPIEQAKAYRRLLDLNGWTGTQLARELAITQSSITRALALLELPGSLQEKVDDGELAPRTAYEIGKLADPAEQVALAEQVAADKLTGDQIAEVVKARKIGKAATAAAPSPRREIKFDDGAKVIVTLPPGASGPEAAIEMLRRAIKKIQTELKAVGKGQAA